ncbi:MAG: formate/nitrite transporter family protein [Clostridiales bacterium]|jgi:formate/nitrite transporter|nr:formate/nitrite transporter family protein [Eubacteriales bacterium]MDH7565660.1 formate/nitrite transporter family protein [Clostridiales bacterium]
MFFTPVEIAENFIDTGCKKAGLAVYKQFLLAILAGAFIAFAAEGSNVAIHTITAVGIQRVLAGTLFAAGLMMVVVAGAELFTGNTLIVVSCCEKKAAWLALLKNWLVVYIGNFLGSILIVYMVLQTGQLNYSGGMLGGLTIKIAAAKTGLTFAAAFFSGIMCNWLVCIAVWMASGAKDIAGKLISIFFPIWLFVTSGFEHSVANMYYIPAGILAKANPAWVQQAVALGAKQHAIDVLSWGTFVTNNLIPVTLGNIVGGGLFVGVVYWLAYLYKSKKKAAAQSYNASASN